MQMRPSPEAAGMKCPWLDNVLNCMQACPAAKTVNIDAVGSAVAPETAASHGAKAGPTDSHEPSYNNNYSRPGGQNVGNFMTARNSSRVSAPPGGASQITFG